MRAQSVVRYVVIFALSLVSFLFLDFMCTCFLTGYTGQCHYVPQSWLYRTAVMIAVAIVRSLYAFFVISGVNGVKVGVKDLLRAMPTYGPPAMCSFITLIYLDAPSWFRGPNPNLYLYHYFEFESWSFLWVGTVVQEFLRGLLYSQAVRGIPRRTPLAMSVLGWHLLAGLLAELVYVYGPLTAYIWFILYWSIILIQAYLVFRAEGAEGGAKNRPILRMIKAKKILGLGVTLLLLGVGLFSFGVRYRDKVLTDEINMLGYDERSQVFLVWSKPYVEIFDYHADTSFSASNPVSVYVVTAEQYDGWKLNWSRPEPPGGPVAAVRSATRGSFSFEGEANAVYIFVYRSLTMNTLSQTVHIRAPISGAPLWVGGALVILGVFSIANVKRPVKSLFKKLLKSGKRVLKGEKRKKVKECPVCHGDLSEFSEDVRLCPHCGVVLRPSRRGILIRRGMGVALMSILGAYLLLNRAWILHYALRLVLSLSGSVSGCIYLMVSTRYRRKLDATFLILSISSLLLPCLLALPWSPLRFLSAFMLMLIGVPPMISDGLGIVLGMTMPLVVAAETVAMMLVYTKKI